MSSKTRLTYSLSLKKEKDKKRRAAVFKDGPHTHGCHNTTYQQAVGSRGIGALRGGAGAYFSYKQCIKQKKNKNQSKMRQKCVHFIASQIVRE